MDSPIVVYAVESDDFAKGDEAFKNSRFTIDIEHKAVFERMHSRTRVTRGLVRACSAALLGHNRPSMVARQ
jgi:hypothetical protein